MSHLSSVFTAYIPHIIMAVVIGFVGWLIAYFCKRLTLRAVEKTKNKTITLFLANVVYTVLILITVVIMLGRLGVPTSSLVAILGASSLAIGLSLRGFLSNLASGLLIIFLRPFKLNDYIEVGTEAGTVTEINLFMTRLTTITNEALFMPNSKVINDFILNKTYFKLKRLDLSIGISYDADINVAKSAVYDVVAKSHYTLSEPAPLVAVDQLADSAINLTVRVWVETDHALAARFELQQMIKQALDQQKISIPYPQMDISIKHES